MQAGRAPMATGVGADKFIMTIFYSELFGVGVGVGMMEIPAPPPPPTFTHTFRRACYGMERLWEGGGTRTPTPSSYSPDLMAIRGENNHVRLSLMTQNIGVGYAYKLALYKRVSFDICI